MAEAVEDALTVLPVPMNTGEASEVQWLAVPPPPAGNGLADHPAALYLARLAPNSRQTISCILGGVAHTLSAGRHTLWTLPWHQVRYPQTSALRAYLAQACAPATANLYITAMRGVLAECWQLGLISAEEKARACNLPSIRGERLPTGRAVVVGELRALLRACAEDKDPSARRDAALVGVLYGSGLRRAEASALVAREVGASVTEIERFYREHLGFGQSGATLAQMQHKHAVLRRKADELRVVTN